jgi:hypothetical protein
LSDEYIELKNEFKDIISLDCDGIIDPGKYLFLWDGYTIYPQYYNIDYWRGHKGIITWNSKLYDIYKDEFNMVLCNGVPMCNNNYQLDFFRSYENKIDGIMLACRHRDRSGIPGDFAFARLEVMKRLYEIGGVEVDCYGIKPYGNDLYKGPIGTVGTQETFPSSLQKLQKINEYKFALCFENCYHELWSWDWLTEKIRDAMKAKTAAVYWGAYNIEDIIPKELYIDYREIDDDIQLVDRLINMSKQEYIDMTEKAYEWTMNCDLGSINKLKNILGELK